MPKRTYFYYTTKKQKSQYCAEICFWYACFMDSGAKNYEVAYLLSPAIGEDEVLMYAGKISGMIEQENGAIRHLERPKKRKLAYAVKKQASAYFAWTTFTMGPGGVINLDKKMKLMPEVLRHITVEEEVETRRPFVPFAHRGPGPLATQKAIPREEQKQEEKLDLEALDKKLEEILGK